MFGIFKKYDVHLCPEVKGRILHRGAPIAGLRVNRSLQYYHDSKPRLDYTVTDPSGQFEFPEVNIRSNKPGSMFGINQTRQYIDFEHEAQTYKLWHSNHPGIKRLLEYEEKLASLNCDLPANLVTFEFKNRENPHRDFFATTICRWTDNFSIFEEHNRTS